MTHFAAQGDITAERLAVVVDDIGLNAVALTSCLHDARTKAEMDGSWRRLRGRVEG